jgi:hypothetical protein
VSDFDDLPTEIPDDYPRGGTLLDHVRGLRDSYNQIREGIESGRLVNLDGTDIHPDFLRATDAAHYSLAFLVRLWELEHPEEAQRG